MKNVQMIRIEQLAHHPENPRKDLGDLTELTDSIRKNGVYQNLTVVEDPAGGKYLVVIGNRRMEAAKAAGLTELPCVVAEMDHKEQIATMLEENMQRQDLTVYEQAQGFQMMMDLGYSPKEIGEKTGFSEKTVRDRIKLTKLNQKEFGKAVSNGANLLDMIEITKLESKADQNEVMKKAGTNNFRQMLNRKLGEQKHRKCCERLGKIAEEEGLQVLPEGTIVWQAYTSLGTPTGTYESEEKIRKAIRKCVKGNKGTQIYCQFGKDWSTNDARLQLYTKKQTEEKELSEQEKERKQWDRERLKRLRAVKKLWAEAYALRMDFIRNYTVTNGCGMTTIGKLILKYALSQQNYWNHKLPENQHWKEKYIAETLEIRQEEFEDKKSLYELAEARGIPQIRATIAWINGGGVFDCDSPEEGFYDCYEGKYSNQGSGMLSERYEFLKEIGYQLSDMEIHLLDGTHPVYKAGEET